MTRDTDSPVTIAWNAVSAACSGFFSPIRLEIMAVVAMQKPMARAYTKVIRDSVMPTAAMAWAPKRETK